MLCQGVCQWLVHTAGLDKSNRDNINMGISNTRPINQVSS
jgi:hypothetical protein